MILVGATPYFCGNVGSGSPRELRDWVEYCNFSGDSTLAQQRAANGSPEPLDIRYWSVGNENWGCGGSMTPEEYCGLYRRFATFARFRGDSNLFLVACGPSSHDLNWTRRFFDTLGRRPRLDGYAMHFYSNGKSPARKFTVETMQEQLSSFARMEQAVLQQRALLDTYDPDRKMGLLIDEWGVWDRMIPEEEKRLGRLFQQNTIRSAVAAAMGLNVFHRQADKVVMCNIAQTVNVLQAMVLTEGERMLRTPTYHTYAMYRSHQGGASVRARFEADEIVFAVGGEEARLPGLSGSASIKDGVMTLTVVNAHADAAVETEVVLREGRWNGGAVACLTADDIHAHNTFDAPDALVPAEARSEVSGASFRHIFPPASVTAFRLELS